MTAIKKPPRHSATLLAIVLGFSAFEATPSQSRDLTAGTLLVANHNLRDANFAESVVLLLRYNDTGAMGLIINRSTGRQFSNLIEGQDSSARWDIPLYFGGPVSHQSVSLLFESSRQLEGVDPVLEHTYFTTNPSVFESLMAKRHEIVRIRAYSGHAGWAPGQLEREIARGGWQVIGGDPSVVFSSNPSDIWPDLVRRINTKLASRKAVQRMRKSTGAKRHPQILLGR